MVVVRGLLLSFGRAYLCYSLSKWAFTARVHIHCQRPHSVSRPAAFAAKVSTVLWAVTFAYVHRVVVKPRLPQFVGWAYRRCFCLKHLLRSSCPDRVLWMPWIWRKIGCNFRLVSRLSFPFDLHSHARAEPILSSWQLLSWSRNSLHMLKPTHLLPGS
jgi:hypothetical protein